MSRTYAACLIALLLATSSVFAQDYERVAVDTVAEFYAGRIQNTGQGPAFFPLNVFGVPDRQATDTTPSTDPREICSLGVDGQMVIGFSKHAIVDGPGPDLIIYENAFRYSGTKIYAEPARVEVSPDGVVWTAFPFNSATLVGCAGVTPTTGMDPFDAQVSGGDAFDLADIGIDTVRWIRLTDLCQMILSDPNHSFYDPTLSGFDLDAITSAHAVRVARQLGVTVQPRAAIVEISVPHGEAVYRVHDVSGALLWEETLAAGVHQRSLYSLPVTCAFASVASGKEVVTVKVLR